jgi:hypothetical protein
LAHLAREALGLGDLHPDGLGCRGLAQRHPVLATLARMASPWAATGACPQFDLPLAIAEAELAFQQHHQMKAG